ncbi:MAG: DUF4239 domain-containing protein [Candidatus Omnitrophica bacterium]|nr:DUF4239 domain-containing protein [Candidatus Omnitrophota bacterium]
MPITQSLLLRFSSLWLGFMVVAILVSLSVAGLVIVRRYISHQKLKMHNDIAAPIFGTIGMAYTVLLAFVVVVAWQGFDKSSQNVETEANCLISVARDSNAFGGEFHDQVISLAKGYGKAVIVDEWPLLAQGKGSDNARDAFGKLFALYTAYTPQNKKEEIFLAESIMKLNELGELRRARIFDSGQGIHPVLWIVLIVGGFVTVAFTFFFGSENHRAQVLMTSLLAALIAMILYTILVLDFPFTGKMGIKSTALRQMYKY